tara:strand:- start:17976 stop:18695 length:720 start_codon:yes stop_codon:yes gene_type:complete
MNEVLLFSGGVDSLIAYYYLNKPKCLYVNVGSRYSKKELINCLELVTKINEEGDDLKLEINLEAISLGQWEEIDANLPLRNAFLIMTASYYGDKIWLILQKGETSIPDRTKEFCKDISNLLTLLHGKKIEVDSPFWNMTKNSMVKWFMKNVGKEKLLHHTFSCFKDNGKYDLQPCGECNACFRKAIAFSHNNIEVDKWKNNIKKWKGIQTYIKKMKEGKYDEERTNETFEVLKKWGYNV